MLTQASAQNNAHTLTHTHTHEAIYHTDRQTHIISIMMHSSSRNDKHNHNPYSLVILKTIRITHGPVRLLLSTRGCHRERLMSERASDQEERHVHWLDRQWTLLPSP